jgi:hypothetical protein
LEEARKASDRGIQESHLVGLVQSNRRMGHLAFFHKENQTLSKILPTVQEELFFLSICVYLRFLKDQLPNKFFVARAPTNEKIKNSLRSNRRKTYLVKTGKNFLNKKKPL